LSLNIQEEQLIDEDFIENIFGRKLRTYVEFYEKYFEKEFGYIYNSITKKSSCTKGTCPQAAKLLTHFKNNP